MLDYYHSNTAAGHSSSSPSSSSVTPPPPNQMSSAQAQATTGLHIHQGYETSNSSDDALSMGPNGYYHPQRSSASSSSRSSSPGSYTSASDTPSARRHSDTHSRSSNHHHHRHDHEDPRSTTPHRQHQQHRQDMTVTPTRATFRSSANPSRDSSPTRSDWNVSNSGSVIQRTPSKRAAANADNRRIAIMDIGTAAAPSTEARTNRSHSTTEGGYDESSASSRRGMSDFLFSTTSYVLPSLPSSFSLRRAYILLSLYLPTHLNIARLYVSATLVTRHSNTLTFPPPCRAPPRVFLFPFGLRSTLTP